MFGLDRAGDGFIWADFKFRRPNTGNILPSSSATQFLWLYYYLIVLKLKQIEIDWLGEKYVSQDKIVFYGSNIMAWVVVHLCVCPILLY